MTTPRPTVNIAAAAAIVALGIFLPRIAPAVGHAVIWLATATPRQLAEAVTRLIGLAP